MNEAELQAEVRRVFPTPRWAEYETLLEKNQERELTASEKTRLNTLRREADVLMLRKGYAAVLLKLRGYQPPAVDQLPKVLSN